MRPIFRTRNNMLNCALNYFLGLVMRFANANKFKVGQVVSYHPFIGQAAVSSGHEITAISYMPNAYGENVAWITGKSGCISFNCLSYDFPDDALYLLRDSRSDTGTNMMFWSIGGRGYTTNIEHAQRYTLKEVIEKNERRDSDIPMLYSRLVELASLRVDMQYLDLVEAERYSDCGEFVLQIPHCYDGNDILFAASSSGGSTYDYQDALVIGEEAGLSALVGLPDGYKVWPKVYIESITRKSVQDTMLNSLLIQSDMNKVMP